MLSRNRYSQRHSLRQGKRSTVQFLGHDRNYFDHVESKEAD